MSDNAIATSRPAAETTTFAILLSLSFCHLLNDMIQSLVPAVYPVLKTSYGLDFGQIGLITLAFQLTASLLQPLVGLAADRRPMPYSLPVAMGFTLLGLFLLAHAGRFETILIAAALVGVGSSVFHRSRHAWRGWLRGGRHGLAQSLFQVGGNAGSALGPLLAAFIVVPRGQGSIAWFTAAALLAILCCWPGQPLVPGQRPHASWAPPYGGRRSAAPLVAPADRGGRWSCWGC